MACLSHFASNVTAIEMDPPYCDKLKQRGYNVICKMIEKVTPEELKHCQVYFWWPLVPDQQNPVWLSQLLAAHAKLQVPATLFVAHDTHWKPDMQSLPELVSRFKDNFAGISRVFFDEGGELKGRASYSQPFYSRPGQWGVFHMAHFTTEAVPHRLHGRGAGKLFGKQGAKRAGGGRSSAHSSGRIRG